MRPEGWPAKLKIDRGDFYPFDYEEGLIDHADAFEAWWIITLSTFHALLTGISPLGHLLRHLGLEPSDGTCYFEKIDADWFHLVVFESIMLNEAELVALFREKGVRLSFKGSYDERLIEVLGEVREV